MYAPDEEYQNVAVTHLLPEYYGAHPAADTSAVLKGLADRLITRHADRWLADALQTTHTQTASAAFAALGRAEAAHQASDFQIVGSESRVALSLFRSVGGGAGAMFAKFEEILAIDWSDQRRECVQASALLLPLLRTHSYAWLETQATLEEGTCATWTGEFERGDQQERAALNQARNQDYGVLFLRVAGLTASRLAQIGNGTAAWRQNLEGLKKYWAGRYPLLRAHQFYSNLSQLARQTQATYPALAWTRELASTDSSLGNKVYGPTLWQFGMAEFDAGFQDAAYRDLQAAARIDARMLSEPRPQIYLATLETTRGALDRALPRLLHVQSAVDRSGELLKLQFAAELGRLQLRRGKYAESRRLFEEARLLGEASWSRATSEQRVLWSLAMAGIYRGLVECEIRTGTDLRQAPARALWSQYRARLFARGNRIAAARDALARGEARLTFAELSSGMAVWLETGRGLEFQWVKSPAPLFDAAARLARDCASETSPAEVARADAAELSHRILGAWDSHLEQVRTLVVETDTAIAQIPWLALVRRNGHYWSEDFAVRVRAGAFGGQDAAPLAPNIPALFVGAPSFSGQDGLGDLQSARAEAEKVSAHFPRSIPMMGQSALLSKVRERLPQVQLFHFTGHGYGGEGGGLLLRGAAGGAALLRAADIQDLDLSRCNLVVLAGCSTAAGERGGPGDPHSLVRGFLHAGAQDVVAGLWDLDSAATQALVDSFYGALLRGIPVDESLRTAVAAARSRYAHPYYWAGLELFSRN